MSKETGGTAFTVFAEQYNYGIGEKTMHTKFDGMTLRDYFAAKAMQGFCASTPDKEWSATWLADESYSIADAMLKARGAQ